MVSREPFQQPRPALRGEVGSPFAIRVRGKAQRSSQNQHLQEEPLTPTLSPQARGEGEYEE
jgi:hypothetical protein